VRRFWVASCRSLVVVSYPPCPFPRCAPRCRYCHSTRNPPHEQLLVGLEAGGVLSSVVCHSFTIVVHLLLSVVVHLLLSVVVHLLLSVVVHLLLSVVVHLLSSVVICLSSVVCRTLFVHRYSSSSIGVRHPYLSALRAVARSSRG
jgi:hypothetical protein